MQREVLKGHLDLLLLAAVADEPAHGYRVVELLKERSEGAFDLAEGTVYPALYRLERQGLLASSWSTAAGRRRRVYRLTSSGRGALSRKRREWTGFSQAMQAVLTIRAKCLALCAGLVRASAAPGRTTTSDPRRVAL